MDRLRRRNEPVRKPKHPVTGSSPSHRPIRQVCAPRDSVALTYSAVQNGFVGSPAAIRSISGTGGASMERNCKLTFFLVNRFFRTGSYVGTVSAVRLIQLSFPSPIRNFLELEPFMNARRHRRLQI